MNMKKHRLPAVCAGIFASVTSAFAAVRTLPTPGPSGYVDRESSVVVAFPTGARGSALNGGVRVVGLCEIMVQCTP